MRKFQLYGSGQSCSWGSISATARRSSSLPSGSSGWARLL